MPISESVGENEVMWCPGKVTDRRRAHAGCAGGRSAARTRAARSAAGDVSEWGRPRGDARAQTDAVDETVIRRAPDPCNATWTADRCEQWLLVSSRPPRVDGCNE